MTRGQKLTGYIFGGFIILGILGGLTLANYQYAQGSSGGYDFLARWGGGRLLFTQGLSPYSAEASAEIQKLYFGRPAKPTEDQVLFAYPLYALVIFGPYALVEDYTLARALWMTTLEMSLIGMAAASLVLAKWRPHILVQALYFVVALLWYYSIRAVINGNVVGILAFLIPAALVCIRSRKDEWAGMLLALTTIKPQVVVLLIGFVVWWAIWQRRWRLIVWLVGGVVVLIVCGMFWVPDWPLENLRQLAAYPGYSPPSTVGAVLSLWWPEGGRTVGWVLTIGLLALLGFEWWAARRYTFDSFLWTAALTLAASQWIGITTDPGNFIALFFALALVLAGWQAYWGFRALWLIVGTLLFLWIGQWILFLSTLEYTHQPMQSPVMFFPMPIFLLVTLYGMRRTRLVGRNEEFRAAARPE